MNEMSVPRMRTMREVANETGISYDAIRKMCLRNEITYIKCGRKILVNLDRFIDHLNSANMK